MWKLITEFPPPENVVLKTKIHDADGERNVQDLKLISRLWFFPDSSMHVFYTPTHWFDPKAN